MNWMSATENRFETITSKRIIPFAYSMIQLDGKKERVKEDRREQAKKLTYIEQ